MLITKFNKMIRNKFLWGFFAVVICIFFVGGSIRTGGCSESDANIIGTVDGQPVSRQEFEKAKLYEIGFRSEGRLSESELNALDTAAWKRLATLRYAEKMGIVCTKQEIDSIIVNDPRFQTNGTFDPERYKAAIRQELGVTTEIIEDYMAQEIVLNRMMLITGNMLLTPPAELNQRLQRLTDMVEVDYAFITNQVKTKKIKIPQDELQEYFEENIDLFRIPEQMNVKYAVFPVSDYTSGIAVTEDEALDYYETNISDYSSRNTNDELVTVAFTNVMDSIKQSLLWEDASYRAKDAATEFVMALMPDRDGTVTPLPEILDERNISMTNSPFFSMMETVEGVDAGYDFNRAAFSLIPSDPERSISDAVMGTSNAYVLIAGEKVDSRLPTFEEVRDEVEPFAKNRKASRIFDEKSEELRNTILEKVEKGKNFRDILEDEDIEVLSSPSFSVYSDMTNEIEHSEILVPSVIALDEGETSDLIPTSEGYVIIHVKSREPGDIFSAELLRPQLVSAMSRYRSSVLFEEMQDYLLEKNVEIKAPENTEENKEL